METCRRSINTSCPEFLYGRVLSGTDHTDVDMNNVGGSIQDDVLDELVSAFVHRMANDLIIGFFFEGRDLNRVIAHERELLRGHLGRGNAYTGRALDRVHQPLGINRGHFRRRHAILRNLCQEREIDEGVMARWVEREQALESMITTGEDCGPEA